MHTTYDQHYQTVNLFGEPYPALLDFYRQFSEKGRLLDLGCGQGRDAIALARMGYDVVGIDHSQVGIDQMNAVAQKESLPLEGRAEDIYLFNDFAAFDFILLDSMFHFAKKEKAQEIQLLERILEEMKLNALTTVCIQDSGQKTKILATILNRREDLEVINRTELTYHFEDQSTGHASSSPYLMISVRKK